METSYAFGIMNKEHRPFCIVIKCDPKSGGMHHLHSECITHCDLGTRNLLLTNMLHIKVASNLYILVCQDRWRTKAVPKRQPMKLALSNGWLQKL
ncbi:hypothetical protein QOT17_006133 [Balamuthia mandrillaris]